MSQKSMFSQAGYTLVELTIGLTVASLVIASVLVGARKMIERVNMNTSVRQISAAVENLRAFARRDPSGAIVDSISEITNTKYGIFTDLAVTSPGTANATIYAPSGFRVRPVYAGSTGTQRFRMKLGEENGGSVPQSICAELVAALEGQAAEVWVSPSNWTIYNKVKSSVTGFDPAATRQNCTGDLIGVILEYSK